MTDPQSIDDVADRFRRELAGVSSRAEYEALKGRYLNREHGLIPALFARLKTLTGAEKAAFGSRRIPLAIWGHTSKRWRASRG